MEGLIPPDTYTCSYNVTAHVEQLGIRHHKYAISQRQHNDMKDLSSKTKYIE